MFVSRTWPTVKKRCNWKYFLGVGDIFFIYFGYRKSWLEVFDTVPEFMFSWFPLFYMIKICCLTWAWTRFVSWTQHSYCLIWCPTHWRNRGSSTGNEHIFKNGLVLYSFIEKCISIFIIILFKSLVLTIRSFNYTICNKCLKWFVALSHQKQNKDQHHMLLEFLNKSFFTTYCLRLYLYHIT